jgi:transcription factor 1
MSIPEGRNILPSSSIATPTNYELKDPFIITHHTEADLTKAIDELEALLRELEGIPKFTGGVIKGKAVTSGLEKYIETLHYPQSLPMADEVLLLRRNGSMMPKDRIGAGTQRRAIFIDTMLRILNLETHAVHFRDTLKIDITDIAARLYNLDKIIQKLQPTVSQQQANLYADQAAFFAQPPNLRYDRRPYEPLQISATDAFPETTITLLDIVPSTIDLDVPGLADRAEVGKLTELFLKIVFSYKSVPLPWVLDRIAPNCAQDLIPQAPSVTNPRAGGRLNPECVWVRMLTEQMVKELVSAWYEWPFKPERFELEMAGMQGDVWAKTEIEEPVETM